MPLTKEKIKEIADGIKNKTPSQAALHEFNLLVKDFASQSKPENLEDIIEIIREITDPNDIPRVAKIIVQPFFNRTTSDQLNKLIARLLLEEATRQKEKLETEGFLRGSAPIVSKIMQEKITLYEDDYKTFCENSLSAIVKEIIDTASAKKEITEKNVEIKNKITGYITHLADRVHLPAFVYDDLYNMIVALKSVGYAENKIGIKLGQYLALRFLPFAINTMLMNDLSLSGEMRSIVILSLVTALTTAALSEGGREANNLKKQNQLQEVKLGKLVWKPEEIEEHVKGVNQFSSNIYRHCIDPARQQNVAPQMKQNTISIVSRDSGNELTETKKPESGTFFSFVKGLSTSFPGFGLNLFEDETKTKMASEQLQSICKGNSFTDNDLQKTQDLLLNNSFPQEFLQQNISKLNVNPLAPQSFTDLLRCAKHFQQAVTGQKPGCASSAEINFAYAALIDKPFVEKLMSHYLLRNPNFANNDKFNAILEYENIGDYIISGVPQPSTYKIIQGALGSDEKKLPQEIFLNNLLDPEEANSEIHLAEIKAKLGENQEEIVILKERYFDRFCEDFKNRPTVINIKVLYLLSKEDLQSKIMSEHEAESAWGKNAVLKFRELYKELSSAEIIGFSHKFQTIIEKGRARSRVAKERPSITMPDDKELKTGAAHKNNF